MGEQDSEPMPGAKPVVVSFAGRHTGMGAYTRYRIFSLRQKKEIKTHRTESSRTGNHWTDFWYLLPGRYFVCWEDVSNSGKHYCGYGTLVVSRDSYEIVEWKGNIPEYAIHAVCDCLALELGLAEPEW